MFVLANAALITLATQITSLYFHDTSVTLEAIVARSNRVLKVGGREVAQTSFDLKANLTNLFDWNCKQVFLFVEASYQTKESGRSRVMVYDAILTSKENAIIRAESIFSEYDIEDFDAQLRGSNVTLKIGWDVMPYIGLMGKASHLGVSRESTHFLLPKKYG